MTKAPLRLNGLRATLFCITIAAGVIVLAVSRASAAQSTNWRHGSGNASTPIMTVSNVPTTSGTAPAVASVPTIAGTAIVGQALGASNGIWSGTAPIRYSYQWQRCDSTDANCTSIRDATRARYTVTASDQSSMLRVAVTAANSAGSAVAQSNAAGVISRSPAARPTWLVLPTISGVAQVGQALTASGSASGATPMRYRYKWLRCDASGANCTTISGATAQIYAVRSGDVSATLQARVTATNIFGSASAQSTATAPVTNARSGIYWGAYMEGTDTYGPGYGDAPWDANTWSLFEAHAGKKVSIVHWGVDAPWTVTFNYHLGAHQAVLNAGDLELVDMNSGSVPLRDIASGVYDTSLTTWLQQARAWGHPFFLRWDWEMNGSWFSWGTTASNQNTPSEYVNAWRHLHDLAVQAGATNITWVWCPNADFAGSTPLEQLYPGDAYVDWTCMDGYNTGGASWQSFSAVFAETYGHLLQVAPAKPIMVAETSSEENGGSKAAWINDALSTLPNSFPRVKALEWFNWKTYENGLWWPWQIESSQSAQTAFANGVSSSDYVPGGSFGALPLLSKIKPP